MTGVSMRTVVYALPLPRNPDWCTKHGSLDGPPSAYHRTGAPSRPAIEVNVPHSWATTPVGIGTVSEASKKNAATLSNMDPSRTGGKTDQLPGPLTRTCRVPPP